MRWLFLPLGLLLSSQAIAEIRINEIYYDHPGVDTGYEFVELINTGGAPVALDGYAIEFHDGASEGWVPVWSGSVWDTVHALFLVGEASVVPAPDVIARLRLQNGPDAVRLTTSGATVDLVGYGDLDSPEFYEGSSAPDVRDGMSLSRVADGVDTDDNERDFEASPPSPGRFNVPRRDVAVVLGERTPRGKVVDVEDALDVMLCNRGRELINPFDVEIVVEDSTATQVARLTSIRDHGEIAVSACVTLTVRATLAEGYHFLRLRVAYAADENPSNDTLRVLRRAGRIPVLISEVMSDPAGACPEYVEICNAGASAVVLDGFRLRDRAHDAAVVTTATLVMAPREYRVITPDPDALLSCFPMLDRWRAIAMEGQWPSLNHTGSGGEADSVIVLDAYGLDIDRIAYPPQPSSARGRSLERVELYAGGGSTWVVSGDPSGGSPGRAYANAIERPPRREGLEVSQRTFDPYGGERLVLTVAGREGVRVVAGVFDPGGRPVRGLGVTAQTPNVFVWDGTRDSGAMASPGIYVATCEFIDQTTGERWVEKVVVGCARRKE